MKRAIAALKLLCVFLIEFLSANLNVMCIILFKRNEKIKPVIVDLAVPQLTTNEILLLSHMITLTPGTVTCFIDVEKKCMKIHMLDVDDSNAVLRLIDQKFTQRILEVTR